MEIKMDKYDSLTENCCCKSIPFVTFHRVNTVARVQSILHGLTLLSSRRGSRHSWANYHSSLFVWSIPYKNLYWINQFRRSLIIVPCVLSMTVCDKLKGGHITFPNFVSLCWINVSLFCIQRVFMLFVSIL